MTAALVLFYVLAALALFSALAMVAFVHNVVAGAMSLVVTMVSLAGIFLLLGAEFLGVVQILIYAGAIMVLLLFVVMLLDPGPEAFAPASRARSATKLVGCAAAAGVAVLLVSAIPRRDALAPAALPEVPLGSIGSHRAIGLALFDDFVLPFEVVGLILLGAIVGAVILARRRAGP